MNVKRLLTAKHGRSLRTRGSEELDLLLESLSDKVADVRSALATVAEDGLEAAGAGVDALVRKTRRGVRALDRRWKRMDGRQKIAVAGGLLTVLAAAAATPTIVRKLRER